MGTSLAQVEDAAVRRALAVTLDATTAIANADPPVLHLASLAEELASEDAPLLMDHNNLDRIIVNRLIECPPDTYPQTPFQYLLGSYGRCLEQQRTMSPRHDAATQAALRDALQACRELTVSYAGLILSGSGVVPEPMDAATRGALQVLDAMLSRDAMGNPLPGTVAVPPGFLEEFAVRSDESTLATVFVPVARELAVQLSGTSPLGDYQQPLAALKELVSIEPIARALTGGRTFLPDLAAGTGRAVQLPGASWLGAAFGVSVLPDPLVKAKPDVLEQCFSHLQTRRQGDVARSMESLRLASKHITEELKLVVEKLLRHKKSPTQKRILEWIGSVIEHNSERAKMQTNLAVAASHGFFVNLDAVLLKLCAPFMLGGPSHNAFWQRVDPRYVMGEGRLTFKDDTKLAANAEEEAALLAAERAAAGASASTSGSGEGSQEFSFICESFFMTVKALHLGVIKVITSMGDDQRRLHYYNQDVRQLEAAVPRMEGDPRLPLLRRRLEEMKAEVDRIQASAMATETVLGDPALAADMVSLYSLLAAWLLRLASPGTAGLPSLPLPEKVPAAWALLPEYFVEDLAEYLLYISRTHPELISGKSELEGIMLFLVVFIGSPTYIRSPYLRSKLSEVLHAWLPQRDNSPMGWQRRVRSNFEMSHLFEAHPLVLQNLVPALLKLYADVEHTERQNQFYVKFNMRQYIGDILEYAWQLQPHRDAWRAFAALEGGRGPYLHFANMLINDSIYLLDESLKKLKELRELETAAADPARLAAMSPQERQEHDAALANTGDQLRNLLYFASGTIRLLATSTQAITAPFMLPEMAERLAAMLNYFMLYLTGPERKSLKVKDPEKYQFKPKELLAQICAIYLNFAAADRDGTFARAVAADGRSYREAMFSEAALVLRQFGLMQEGQVSALEALAARVAEAAAEGAAEEEVMGDIPDDFLDPILSTLMRDPVIMPSSNTTIDRPTIMRHLLSDPRDPINRKPLTPDMLLPDLELKNRINTWLKEQRSNRMRQ